ncbi:MAG: DUF4175 family protein [Planctomycetota bacterium]
MTPDRVHAKISSLRGLLRRLVMMAGISRVVLIAAGVAALCLLSDWTFRLSGYWRISLGLASVAGVGAAVFWFFVRPLLVSMPDDQIALLYEREFPELSDVLVSAVQLARVPGAASPEMIAAVISDAESASDGLEPARVPRRAKLSRMALAATVAAAAALAFCLAAPGAAKTFALRYLDPFGPAEWPRNTRLIIEVAGSTEPVVSVARGEQIAIKVTAVNARRSPLWAPPAKVWLDYAHASGEQDSRPMRRALGNVYQAYFNDLPEDLTVSARARDAQTGEVLIRVIERPRVEEAWLSFEYPKYTGRPPDRPSRSVSEVRAIVGTSVRVQIKTNRALRPGGAAIRIDPTGTVQMRPTNGNGDGGSTHEGEFVLALGMKWFRVELTDTAGNRNKNPRTFQLQVVDDKPPRVKILKPGGQTRCTPHATLPIEAGLKDDLALRGAWLRYALGPKDAPLTRPLELDAPNAKEAHIATRWDLSDLRVKVGQTISYRVEADDHRDVFPAGSGQTRQVGRSDEYFIRIVSSADLASELDRRLFALRNEVKKAKAHQEGDRRKVNELLRKISEGQPMTNDDRGMAADAENVQRELARNVARIAVEVGKIRERMQDNRIGSFADRRRLDDINAALGDIARADMPRAAQFINSARKDLASRNGRDSLQTAAGMQQGIIKRLENVLASMAHNEDIDNLVRAARELLRKQRTIKTDTAAFAGRPGTFGADPKQLKPADFTALNLLARRQRGACDDMRNLEQQMLDVYQRLKERDAKRAEIVRLAQLGASRDQIRLMMEEAAGTLTGNRIGLAAARQDVAIKGLERLLETLQKAREEAGSDEALAQAVRDLEEALADVQRLRKQQEGHAADAAEINKNAQQAKRLKELRREINKLRGQQDKTSTEAEDDARLDDAAKQEASHAGKAAEIKKQLDKEAESAAKRRAAHEGDIKKSAGAVSGAESQMGSARDSMQRGQGSDARKSAKTASDKLAEAENHLDNALKTIEKQRLADTKEAALKQGDTAKDAAAVADKLKRLAKENESTSRPASTGLDNAGGKVGEAGQSMRSSHANMDRNDTVPAEQDAKEAAKRLGEAEDMLKNVRDDLRKKQKQQKLLDLVVELQPMLEKQIEINDETRRIDAATAEQKLSEPSRPDKVRLGQLSGDESALANKAAEILKKVEGEDAPVFAWACQKLIKDMGEVGERLARFETDAYTQDAEKDIADTLRMLIDALKREQSKTQQGDGGGGGGGGGGEPMLVPPSAQLKLLKIRELIIHNQTKRIELKRLLKTQKKLTPLQKKRVLKLAEEQVKLGELTTQLAESLEREARKYQEQQEQME